MGPALIPEPGEATSLPRKYWIIEINFHVWLNENHSNRFVDQDFVFILFDSDVANQHISLKE